MAIQIQDRIKDLLPVSSGKLKDSIKATVDENGNLIDITIDGNDYFKYVDQGRLAGTFPNLGAIQEWAARKGLAPKAAFAIAVSIKDKGIEPMNIIDQLKDEEELDDQGLADAFADDVEDHLAEVLNKIFS